MDAYLLAQLTAILGLGIACQWIAWRLNVPSILLLVIAGLVAGPVTGLILPDRVFGDMLFPLVSASVAVILFEGGLNLRVADIRGLRDVVGRMVTVGLVITWIGAGALAYWLLDFPLKIAILFGAILVVTGPTVVTPMLREIQPSQRAAELLRWEGIINDPLGALLAVLTLECIVSGTLPEATSAALLGVGRTVVISLLTVAVAATVLIAALRNFWIPDLLENSAILVVVLAVHTTCNAVQPESGLFAVTLLGIVLANQPYVSVDHVVKFKENLRVLLIGGLFIILAGRVDATALYAFGWESIAFVAALILLVRPVAIGMSTIGSEVPWRERVFLSAMAPRGIVAAAVASMAAFELAGSGFGGVTDELVVQAFAIVTLTITGYGLLSGWVARRLGLSEESPQGVLFVGAHEWVLEIADALEEHGFRTVLIDENWRKVREARDSGFEVYHGSVASRDFTDSLPLEGVGRLVALTANDEANLLAAAQGSDLFGRANAFHLRPCSNGGNGEQTNGPMTSRVVTRPGIDFAELDCRFARGADVEVAQLTESCDYEVYRSRPVDTLELFCIRDDRLYVFAENDNLSPIPGDLVVGIVGGTETTTSVESEASQSGRRRPSRPYDVLERWQSAEQG